MIIPQLKNFDCVAHDPIDQWSPESEDEVCYHLSLHIGQPDQVGADYFDVQIVTPEAINRMNLGRRLAKYHIVISPYSWEIVLQRIEEILRACGGDSWEQISRLLAQHFDWEFANYRE
jgi:hypothetical protein